ncbi:MAG TPA: hypothetical protein VFW41_05050 [Gaiellaceae bacterium]|nr:hypothetical protein [Gaiellaceae bacterium]
MKIAAVLCAPLGHRWHPIASDTPYPVLECGRCGRTRELTAESSGPEGWMSRGARAGTMRQMMDPRGRR